MSKQITHLTDETFDEFVEKNSPILIDAWAEWCAPCKAIAPTFTKLSEEYGDKISFAKLDTDSNLETARKLRILNIPTFFIFSNGNVVSKWAGADPRRLEKEIKQIVKKK